MNYNKYVVAVVLGIVGMTVSNIYAAQLISTKNITPQVIKQKITNSAFEHKHLGFSR